ncbi:taste receptor type 2 member 4-like [Paroedura picta]|uniref:taste receptor type 2 member 4-like n=1 Tax=Paroedura picta TaxID=143630 RepID=UPI00405634F9
MPEFDSLNLACLVALATMIFVGVMGNGFIALTNALTWIQSKTMSPLEMILTALSLSRLVFLGLLLSVHYLYFRDVNDPDSLPDLLIFSWAFSNAMILWTATCLALFYCVKLVNFPKAFFMKMKLCLSRMVPMLLLGSGLVSFAVSLPIVCLEGCIPCCNKTRVIQGNNSNTKPPHRLLSGMIYIAGSFPSFVIVVASSVLLICSLNHHAQKMQQTMGGLKDHRMDIHIKAIKTLLSFAVLFTASFVAVVSLAAFSSPWIVITSNMALALYNSGHSLMLIAMNPKLKQPLIRGLQELSLNYQNSYGFFNPVVRNLFQAADRL